MAQSSSKWFGRENKLTLSCISKNLIKSTKKLKCLIFTFTIFTLKSVHIQGLKTIKVLFFLSLNKLTILSKPFKIRIKRQLFKSQNKWNLLSPILHCSDSEKNPIIFEVQGKSTPSERCVSKHLSITKEQSSFQTILNFDWRRISMVINCFYFSHLPVCPSNEEKLLCLPLKLTNR